MSEGLGGAVLFESDLENLDEERVLEFLVDGVWTARLKLNFRTVDLQNRVVNFWFVFFLEKMNDFWEKEKCNGFLASMNASILQ